MPRAPTHRETERDSQQEKIPRPPNAWILYRTDLLNQWKANRSPHEPPSRQSDISRLVSARWKAEDSAIKLEYEKRAAIAKAEHKKRYPDYKYTPVPKEVKEKLRAEERERKKRAREEAKAAKAARRASGPGHYRKPSYPSPPSGSNVRLDNMAPPPLPRRIRTKRGTLPARRFVVDPTQRGCGPSPPIDYNPESPSSSSTLSSTTEDMSSSPSPSLPSSSQLAPTSSDASNAWQPNVPSPFSSSPNQQPPPAYPSSYVHSPMPSRHTSFNLLSSSSSTPSESPPSYSEGEAWHAGPPDSAYQSYAPLPDFQSEWNTPLQTPSLLQPDVTFPLPPFDPLSALSGNDQFSVDAATANAVFDLSAPHTGSANSPPGEFELDADTFTQQLAFLDGQAALRPSGDQLMVLLDMPEFHNTVEDRADEAGLPEPGVSDPSTLESFAAFVNAHPQDALTLADPNFYNNLGMQILQQFPSLVHLFPGLANSFTPQGAASPPQYVADPNVPVPTDFAAVQPQQVQGQAFDSTMYEMFMQQPELAMPTPVHPINVSNVSVPPTPVQSEPSHSLAGTPYLDSTPVESAPAPAPARARYVPPVGAAFVGRRRVGGRHPMARKADHSDSD